MWLQTWAEPKRVPPEAWSCRITSPLQGKQGNELLLCLNMLLVRPGHIAQGLPSFYPSSELSSYRVRLQPDTALFSVLGVVPLGSSRYLRRVCGGKCTLTFYPKQTHPFDRRIVFFFFLAIPACDLVGAHSVSIFVGLLKVVCSGCRPSPQSLDHGHPL